MCPKLLARNKWSILNFVFNVQFWLAWSVYWAVISHTIKHWRSGFCMSAIKYPQSAITTGSLFVKQDLSSLWYTVIDITSLWYIIIVFLLQKWGWLLGDTEEKKNFPLICSYIPLEPFYWSIQKGSVRKEVWQKRVFKPSL